MKADRLKNFIGIRILLCLSLLAIVILGAACGDDEEDVENGSAGSNGDEITIGALLDLSGSWQTLGRASQATLEIAVEDHNDRLESQGQDTRVRLIVEDTGLNPDQALEKLRSLADQGVRIVIGPQSSSEVTRIKEYADANGIIVISQGSTASALSLGGDNIFRLALDDRREAAALVVLMDERGQTGTVLPVCRDDLGNKGLCDSTSQLVEQLGGTILPRVTYAGNASPADVIQRIKTALGDATSPAIYLAAFEEAVPLFAAAASDDALGQISWYGTSSLALIPQLVDPANQQAAQFAEEVGLPNPIFGLDVSEQQKWQPVFNEVRTRVGYDPDAFALSTYDALTISVAAYQQAGGVDDLTAYKNAFVATARSNDSLSGPTELNDAGDRDSGVFDFWAVNSQGNTLEWVKVATYMPTGDGEGTITGNP